MSSNQSGEGEIRKNIVEADLVDCMVALPGQLFYSTQIPACLWFLARSKKNGRFHDRRGATLFIDARKLGTMVDRVHRELSDEDIAKIAGNLTSRIAESGRTAASLLAENVEQRQPGAEVVAQGTAEFDLNFYKDAIQSFSRALQLDPSSAEAHLGLALAQWGAGKTSEATASFEEGIRRFPRDSPHYTKYARMLLELGEQTGDRGAESHAVLLLQKAISLNPSQPDAHYELGNLALSKGNVKQAVRELEAAARLDPGSSSTRYALSRAYRRLGRNEEASKEMQVYNKLKAGEDATP